MASYTIAILVIYHIYSRILKIKVNLLIYHNLTTYLAYIKWYPDIAAKPEYTTITPANAELATAQLQHVQ